MIAQDSQIEMLLVMFPQDWTESEVEMLPQDWTEVEVEMLPQDWTEVEVILELLHTCTYI